MTTTVGCWLETSNRGVGEEALGRARELVEEVERRLSRFRAESELCQLNQRAGCGAQPVSRLLFEVVQAALGLASASDGLVDPTVLPALVRAGYGPGAATGSIGYRSVRLLSDLRIELPASVALDLGGVAKGWLADRIAARLSRLGPTLVDIGGDLCARGPKSWGVGVEDPLHSECILARLSLSEGAVATSSVARRRWGHDLHHLIDPRTGHPAQTDLWQATVLAPTAVQAEGAAKTALLLGTEKAQLYLRQLGLAGILVGKDGKVDRLC